MQQRFVSIWFCYLKTDWFVRRHQNLKDIPFVLAEVSHGRKVITAINPLAQKEGIAVGMVVADARASVPQLQAVDDVPGLNEKLLHAIGQWCDRFTPVVAVDAPHGLLLNVTGCAHLWGGETPYLKEIQRRFKEYGYHTRMAIADTPGAAWAVARYGNKSMVQSGKQSDALMDLPPAALRLSVPILEKLHKLGFRNIKGFMHMQRSALRRRFGKELLLQLDKALGHELETLLPILPPAEYTERLPCLEPIRTQAGIEIAIQKLLDQLCTRLQKEGKGIRNATLKGYRVDGHMVSTAVSTVLPSVNTHHLFRLFELKIPELEPDLGIEMFTLEATALEDLQAQQETLFEITGNLADKELAELVDRISSKLPSARIHRYLPVEGYWPEQSIQATPKLTGEPTTAWRTDKQRPVELLNTPRRIEVTAPIPDYPPMLFTYMGALHKVTKADGPERIERAWWMDRGYHRDYYAIEDEQGRRYWIYRLGHYDNTQPPGWFLHGYFA
ncbi:protein ImuB [Filimonas zeae]|uniref:Protein ImuB n=1 Tax=Filimonas zeae TaxID=1737353 RepID=A0A917J0T5_9BACT|nr:DNA polymerase Y family protein [Filimonas zeae]MDR6340131.1 protein ImuB [Filimonas zeae]GGH71290.1 protein ImuB [Filimonas zeae]